MPPMWTARWRKLSSTPKPAVYRWNRASATAMTLTRRASGPTRRRKLYSASSSPMSCWSSSDGSSACSATIFCGGSLGPTGSRGSRAAGARPPAPRSWVSVIASPASPGHRLDRLAALLVVALGAGVERDRQTILGILERDVARDAVGLGQRLDVLVDR